MKWTAIVRAYQGTPAADTALPKFVFAAAWLHDRLVVVPDKQNAFWLFSWAMTDAALVPPLLLFAIAKAPFDVVVASTRSPAAIVAASIGSNFVVLMFCYQSMFKQIDIFIFFKRFLKR